MEEQKQVLTITEASRHYGVTRQAVYVAIKQKKLKAFKRPEDDMWCIHLKDLEEYRQHRYSRARSMYHGELLFDNTKGFYSISQVSKLLSVPAQKIYYATRTGLLRAIRRGTAWVVHVDDVKAYQESYLNKRQSEETASKVS